MARKPIELHRGDPCPNCGGELQALGVLDEEQYRRIYDRENPLPVPMNVDTANPQQRLELGELHQCVNPLCRYRARFPHEGGASQTRDAARTRDGSASDSGEVRRGGETRQLGAGERGDRSDAPRGGDVSADYVEQLRRRNAELEAAARRHATS